MAKLTPIIKTREVVKTEEYTDGYTLQLSQEEYIALMVLVGSISGDSQHPLRKITNKLWDEVFKDYFIDKVFYDADSELYSSLAKGYSASVS